MRKETWTIRVVKPREERVLQKEDDSTREVSFSNFVVPTVTNAISDMIKL
jgi:hypothetical protein